MANRYYSSRIIRFLLLALILESCGSSSTSHVEGTTTLFEETVSGSPFSGIIRTIAVDNSNLYWTLGDGEGGAVVSIPLNGNLLQGKCITSSAEFKFKGRPCTLDLALSPSGMSNTILITPSNLIIGAGNCFGDRTCGPGLQAIPLNFSSLVTLAQSERVASIESDNAFFYWNSGGGGSCPNPCTSFSPTDGGTIRKISVAGGTTTIIAELLSPDRQETGTPVGIALDESYIYWTEQRLKISGNSIINHPDGDALKRASKIDGSEMTVLVTGLKKPGSLKINHGILYWAELFEGQAIKKMNASCAVPCAPTILASTSQEVIDLEVDDTYIYWIESGPSGTLNRVLHSGGTPEIIATITSPQDITQDMAYIYWTEVDSTSAGISSQIKRVHK